MMFEEMNLFLGDGLLDLGIAVLILALGWLLALVAGKVVERLTRKFGDGRIQRSLGVELGDKTTPPSRVVAGVVRTAVILYATLEAFNTAGFVRGAELMTRFLEFGANVLLGVGILGLGLYFGRLAGDAVRISVSPRWKSLARVVQVAVVVLTAFMALNQMGVAEDIVELLFIFTAGAFSLALALAFGLGGREAAREICLKWLAELKNDDANEDD